MGGWVGGWAGEWVGGKVGEMGVHQGIKASLGERCKPQPCSQAKTHFAITASSDRLRDEGQDTRHCGHFRGIASFPEMGVHQGIKASLGERCERYNKYVFRLLTLGAC